MRSEQRNSERATADARRDGSVGLLGRLTRQVQYGRPAERSVFTWFFDDAHPSVYEHRGVFTEHNVAPGIAAYTDGLDGHEMRWAQLTELSDIGWEILNHSKSHAKFDQLTLEEIHEEVYASTATFLDRGISPSSFVYPYNISGGTRGKGIVAELYDFAFGTGGLLDGSTPIDPLQLNRISGDGHGHSVAELKTLIDRAIETNTGIVFYGHDIIDDSATNEGYLETSTEKIAAIIEYVREEGGIWATNGTEEVIRTAASRPWMLGDHQAQLWFDGSVARFRPRETSFVVENAAGNRRLAFEPAYPTFGHEAKTLLVANGHEFRSAVTAAVDGTRIFVTEPMTVDEPVNLEAAVHVLGQTRSPAGTVTFEAPLTIKAGARIEGCHFDADITVAGQSATIRDYCMSANVTLDVRGTDIVVAGGSCSTAALLVRGSRCRFTGNERPTFTFTSDSSTNAAVGNVGIESVTDHGTNNAIPRSANTFASS